ncbi:MAG: hypothetical protein LBU51_08075, partial [Bacteroidales bacterium]|nr:hypothetical protein [Bacteroidales bacterium]
MKNSPILKNIIAVLIDVLLVLVISQLFFFSMALYGFGSQGHHTLLNLFIIALLYSGFAFFNHWKTPGRKLLRVAGNKDERKVSDHSVPFFRNTGSLFTDWFLIFSLTMLLDRVLRSFLFTETMLLMMIVAPIYYMIFYFLFRRTFGDYLFGIALTSKKEKRYFHVAIFIRELVVFGFAFWVPMLLLYVVLGRNDILINASVICLWNIVILIFYHVANNNTWWGKLTATR